MMSTSWPKGSALPQARKSRKRPPSRKARAERRERLDQSQLPGRKEYAVKVFAWSGHDSKIDAMDAAKVAAPTLSPVAAQPAHEVKEHPECIDIRHSPGEVRGAHTIMKLRSPSPVPHLWRECATRKF